HCGTALDFQTLMLSLNPYTIRCDGCDEKIRPNPWLISVIVLVLFALTWFVWDELAEQGIRYQTSLMVIVGIIFGCEYLLYEALRQGWLASNLVFPHEVIRKADSNSAASSEKTHSADAAKLSSSILPQIKTRQNLEALKAELADKPEHLPITETLFGDLVLTYALDLDEQRIFLSPAHIEQYGLQQALKPESLRSIAEANALPILSNILQSQQGKIIQLTCHENLMACGVLFHPLWDQIEEQTGSEIVIAVPHRDHIWYVSAKDEEAIEELRAAVSNSQFDGNQTLSRLLFIREEGEWEVFDD
ncbi:MAG: hypothetical protein ACPGYX_07655, partial [Oceanobacter sp.]